jgi:ABC-type molybdenum transport system ATPase subunit/photorepair protein PhrA
MSAYELSGDRQNKLADEMLKRAQELDFSKLEITDIQGTLLARSPVVGPNMIILQRAISGREAG